MVGIPVTVDADRTLTIKYVRAQFTLTTQVLADGTGVSIPSGATIDGKALTTPMALNAGTYTVTVADQISVGGVLYNYSSSTVT